MKTNRTLILAIAAVVWICPVDDGLAKGKASASGGLSDAHTQRGIELAQEKKFDESIAEFTKAIQANADNPRAYCNRGTAYRSAGRFPEAMADFTKAIKMAPGDSLGYFERAQTELAQNQHMEALADLDKALELKPGDGNTLKFRGFAWVGRTEWDKAIADFTASIEKIPTDPQNYERRAFAYRSLAAAARADVPLATKNYDAAIADYTKSIEVKGDNSEVWAKRGYTYSLMQKYELAIPDYEQAMKLNPNDIDTPQRLQYARGMLAARNAPPPGPTPVVVEKSGLLTPLNIAIVLVLIVVGAVVAKVMTRGKAETPSSSNRIR
jgi:tetratricopeptide (TPR) repeat protein